MPLLDVSDVLSDDDFNDDTLRFRRRAQTVGDNGRAVDDVKTYPMDGVVTNDQGDTLDRSPDNAQVHGNIVVHTQTALCNAGDDYDGDIVIWQNREYLVKSINDWSTYGDGYIMATCELLPLAG